MRKTIFRGKRIDNGEFAYGYYYYDCGSNITIIISREIMPSDGGLKTVYNEVHYESVGQYTGQEDKKRTKEYPDGQKFYGGDIVRWSRFLNDEIREVEFKDGCFGVVHCFEKNCNIFKKLDSELMEIIGNKFDNSELLKRK